MSQPQMERPCIHVCLGAGVDPALYRWVEIGAEEEGVPCAQVDTPGGELAELAYYAAQGSRLNVGVGISAQAVALHEQHMPTGRPVLVFALEEDAPRRCRRMGANAARMVIHRPLLLDVALPPILEPVEEPAIEVDAALLARAIRSILIRLKERGIL
jgi:hypothetical protein